MACPHLPIVSLHAARQVLLPITQECMLNKSGSMSCRRHNQFDLCQWIAGYMINEQLHRGTWSSIGRSQRLCTALKQSSVGCTSGQRPRKPVRQSLRNKTMIPALKFWFSTSPNQLTASIKTSLNAGTGTGWMIELLYILMNGFRRNISVDGS